MKESLPRRPFPKWLRWALIGLIAAVVAFAFHLNFKKTFERLYDSESDGAGIVTEQ